MPFFYLFKELLSDHPRKSPQYVTLSLPVMSGTEVSKRLKNSEDLKHIPIILMTASVNKIKKKFKECNADDFVLKPLEPEELLEKIKKFIG